MSYLVLDLETVPDDAWTAEKPDDFPRPIFHRIVSLGAWAFSDRFEPGRFWDVTVCPDGQPRTEQQALSTFVAYHAKATPTLVGWNIRAFDNPVLAHRCLVNGVPWPAYYAGERGWDCRYRYHLGGSFDLEDYLADHGASKHTKLGLVAKMLGLPGKGDVNGGDVGALWTQGRHAEIRAYCAQDVAQTALVWLRVELLRGVLDLAAFQRVGRLALDAIRARPETAELQIDEGRYLLTGGT